MTDRLPVEIDGPALSSVPEEFETSGPFVVEVDNLGRATHVHLGLEGGLEAADANPDANHFVDSEESFELSVEATSQPAEGVLTIATGHGAEDATVPIRVGSTGSTRPSTEPRTPPDTAADEGFEFDNETISVVAVAVLGIVLAGIALLLTQNFLVLAGAVLVVGIAVLGTIYLLVA